MITVDFLKSQGFCLLDKNDSLWFNKLNQITFDLSDSKFYIVDYVNNWYYKGFDAVFYGKKINTEKQFKTTFTKAVIKQNKNKENRLI